MTDDNHELSEDAPGSCADPVDFAFLRRQTFEDVGLERELLLLFVAQARRVVPSLPGLSAQAQADSAHLLKGSARGIGAWIAADQAGAYEADEASRARAYPALEAAFADVEAAIVAHLGGDPAR